MFFANVRIDNRILFCLISLFASALKNEWLGRTTAKSKTSLHARLNIPISKSKKIWQDKASVILFANVVFYAKLSDHAMFSTDWRTKGQLCNSTVRHYDTASCDLGIAPNHMPVSIIFPIDCATLDFSKVSDNAPKRCKNHNLYSSS